MADEKLDTQIRREQIAEAALGLVAAQGLRKLSIAAVARRVGLVPSGLYRHFKSKDEIIDAVLDVVEKRLMTNVVEARGENDNPVEALRGVLMRHVKFIREGRAIPRLIFSDDMHGGHPDRKQRVLRIIRGYAGAVAEIVQQGQRQGLIRTDLDPEMVVIMILGTVVPAGILWHLTDGGFDVTRHAQRVWPLLERAVGPPA
ncbi:MAG: TetR/AcrR family transcriptional regulator [Planctomycetota bacterium]